MSIDADHLATLVGVSLAHRDSGYAQWLLANHCNPQDSTLVFAAILGELVRSFPFYQLDVLQAVELMLTREAEKHGSLSQPSLHCLVHMIARAPLCPLPEQYVVCYRTTEVDKLSFADKEVSRLVSALNNSSTQPITTFDSGLHFQVPTYPNDPPQLHAQIVELLVQLKLGDHRAIGNSLVLLQTSWSFMWEGHLRHGKRDSMLAYWDALVDHSPKPFIRQALHLWRMVYLMLDGDDEHQSMALVQAVLTVYYADRLAKPTRRPGLIAPSFRGLRRGTEPRMMDPPPPNYGGFDNSAVRALFDRLKTVVTDPASMLTPVSDPCYLRFDHTRMLTSSNSHVLPVPMAVSLDLPSGWEPLQVNGLVAIGYPMVDPKSVASMQLMNRLRGLMHVPQVDGVYQGKYWVVPLNLPDQHGTATLGPIRGGLASGPIGSLFASVDVRMQYLRQCCFLAIMGCGRSIAPNRLLIPRMSMVDDPNALVFHQLVEEFTFGMSAVTPLLAAQLLADLSTGVFDMAFGELEVLGSWSVKELAAYFRRESVVWAAPEVLKQIVVRSRLVSVLVRQVLRERCQ
jgi:hypothetical protein